MTFLNHWNRRSDERRPVKMRRRRIKPLKEAEDHVVRCSENLHMVIKVCVLFDPVGFNPLLRLGQHRDFEKNAIACCKSPEIEIKIWVILISRSNYQNSEIL